MILCRIDGHGNRARAVVRRDARGDALGGLAFVTGARYSNSAIATMDTRVWILRKRDFEQLLRESPLLEEQVRELVQAQKIAGYLKERHGFNADDAARWVRGAVRSLETAAAGGVLAPYAGETRLFITPGFQFRVVDAMLTNFHLPRSTLFMLVSALAGLERMQAAYAHAIAESELIKQYEFMLRIFANAGKRLATAGNDGQRRQILMVLGRSALGEHAQWLLMHRERSLDQAEIWRLGSGS